MTTKVHAGWCFRLLQYGRVVQLPMKIGGQQSRRRTGQSAAGKRQAHTVAMRALSLPEGMQIYHGYANKKHVKPVLLSAGQPASELTSYSVALSVVTQDRVLGLAHFAPAATNVLRHNTHDECTISRNQTN